MGGTCFPTESLLVEGKHSISRSEGQIWSMGGLDVCADERHSSVQPKAARKLTWEGVRGTLPCRTL